ncbi:hypothetical protein BLNAU_8712 [Blattamonas nauphoetae]|uniref:Right handed beta helix domain-containing protein n=1 Tax=Blattamonas nauphoetae TaxID=2049346 RepID=A0ABQ9XXY2_9EUKA|nr:hypothetical protein BLNAU_8712 [Blattamonas nauphoetae]
MQLTLLLCLSILNTELQSHPLVDFLEKQTTNNLVHNTVSPQQIAIPRGHFLISEYPIQSLSLVMTGINTTITYRDLHPPLNEASSSLPKAERHLSETPPKVMFLLANSTVSLMDITLDSTEKGSRIGTLSSSSLTLRCCQILSNMEHSPFAVGDGWGTDGSSILLVGSSYRSQLSRSLLPLASLIHVQQRPDNQRDKYQSLTPVSITAIGLSITNTHLPVGTGPLLDFGTLRSVEADNIALSTTLSSCILFNTTSSPSQPISGIPSATSQKIVGCGISNSSDHLYGTTCNDMNLGGSLLSCNTSFVQCSISYTRQHYSSQTELETDADFTDCTFKQCGRGARFGGALLMSSASIIVQVKQCSFQSCSASQEGGAICCGSYANSNTFTLQDSSFIGCSSSIAGSVQLLNRKHSVSGCVFYDSQSEYSAGALRLIDCVFTSPLSNILFCNCRHNSSHDFLVGGGGAVEFYGGF